MGVGGADDVGTVADADTRGHSGAVGQHKGVVVGGQTRGGDLAALLQVLHLVVGADVTVDEHTGHHTGAVTNQNGLHQTVGHLDAHHIALQGDELAQHGAVVDLGGGDLSGGHGLTLAQLDDVGDGQLVLTLIGAGGAGHTHPVADLEVAGHGEAVDAAGLVLHVDAVEEGRFLVVAGGVGGDHALDGVLVAVLGLGLYLSDGRDLHGVDEPQQILADLVVGVVLLGAVVADAGLHLKVGHEGRTGDHHHATAL